MKKYIALVLVRLTNSLQYRTELLLWLFLDIIPFVLIIPVWVIIYQGGADGDVRNGFSLVSLISYYVATIWIMNMSDTHFEDLWIEQVRMGRIDTLLPKPVKLIFLPITNMIAQKSLSIVMFILPLSILSLMFSQYIVFPSLLTHLPIVIVFAFLGLLLNSAFSLLLIAGVFWMDQVDGLAHFKWAIGSVFSGALAPLSFFPASIQRIAQMLPFQDVIQAPALYMTGALQASDMLIPFVRLSVYCLLLWCVAVIVWNKSLQKYTSAGG